MWKDGFLRFRGAGLEVYQGLLSRKLPCGGKRGEGVGAKGW